MFGYIQAPGSVMVPPYVSPPCAAHRWELTPRPFGALGTMGGRRHHARGIDGALRRAIRTLDTRCKDRRCSVMICRLPQGGMSPGRIASSLQSCRRTRHGIRAAPLHISMCGLGLPRSTLVHETIAACPRGGDRTDIVRRNAQECLDMFRGQNIDVICIDNTASCPRAALGHRDAAHAVEAARSALRTGGCIVLGHSTATGEELQIVGLVEGPGLRRVWGRTIVGKGVSHVVAVWIHEAWSG